MQEKGEIAATGDYKYLRKKWTKHEPTGRQLLESRIIATKIIQKQYACQTVWDLWETHFNFLGFYILLSLLILFFSSLNFITFKYFLFFPFK